jgi:ribosomal protein L11 methyltransferase
LNGITNIRVQEGDASVLPTSPTFDLLIANINRNILLQDMPRFAQVLKPKGQLLLSGFYESDVPLLLQKGEELGLSLEKETCEEGWAMLFLRKCE